MAQSKVTFYYGSRKKSLDIQPSKRRKVLHTSVSEVSPVFSSEGEISGKPVFTFETQQQKSAPSLQQFASTAKSKGTVEVESKSRVVGSQTTRSSTRKKFSSSSSRWISKNKKSKNASIKDFMSIITDLQASSDVELHLSDSGSEVSGPTVEITEARDDHAVPRTPPVTPTKRTKVLTSPVAQKRSKTSSKEILVEGSCPKAVRSRTYQMAGRKSAKKCLDGALEKFSENIPVTNSDKPIDSLNEPVKVQVTQSKEATNESETLKDKVDNMIRKVSKSKPVTMNKKKESSSKSSAEIMKEKLAKCSKLEELQKRLAAVRDETKKMKEKDVERTRKNQALKNKEPNKIEETKTLPAFEKYHSLATPPPPTLALPYRYKILQEMFRSMDTIVSMLHNRSEQCTFKKLKEAVQEMCRKTFQLQHIGQIKKVYSAAYNFSQRKNTLQQQRDKNKGESDYQLHIDPNITLQESGGTVTKSGQPRFIASAIIERRTIFHCNLVNIVKEHHKEFLSRLPQPISIPDEQLKRWHPKFPLDQIPEIQPEELPQPPNVLKYHTAKDVLDKAKDMSPRVARALHLVAENSDKLKNNINKQKASTAKTNDVKGVSKSLLDRIRAKEAKKIEQLLLRDPSEDKKVAMLERLPEICGIIRNFFLSEKKAAILIESAISTLRESSRSSLSPVDAEEHINLLVEVLPDWIKVVNIRKEKYLKIDKNKDLKQVNIKLAQLIKESK